MGARSVASAIVLAVVFCAPELVLPALAAEPDSQRVELKVTAAGLVLSKAEGARAFLDRLTSAAKNACEGPTDLATHVIYEHCYEQAIVDAVRNINQPVLLQAYIARFPTEGRSSG